MRSKRITFEQCEVFLNGVFQIDNYSYMLYRRPWEYSGTSTVVHLLGSVFPQMQDVKKRLECELV